jgi:hypothetical protein
VTDPAIRALVREARAVRRVRRDARCEGCRDTRHLTRTRGRVLCYACRQANAGRTTVEIDHVAGRPNVGGLLIALEANDHRTVTDIRQRLGIDAWPPSGEDPVRRLAHVLAGLGSLLVLLAEWLLALAGHLEVALGAGWWTAAPRMPVAA